MAANNLPFHLHHFQLFALSSVGQLALQKLIGCFAKKEKPDAVNEKQALSQIFNDEKREVKNINNIFVNPIVTNAVYKDTVNHVFQDEIEIEKLDTNTCAEILRRIKAFQSSKDHARLQHWNCTNAQNHLNKCCQMCNNKHPCPQCGREKCQGKCCVTKKNHCSHPCNHCQTTTDDCNENKYQCCSTCLCLGCVLKTQQYDSWHQLIKAHVDETQQVHNVCPVLLVRLSISIISTFRNITMHLTIPTCQSMDNGTFSDPNAPAYCTSWKYIKDTLLFAVKNLLSFLKNSQYFTEDFSEMLSSICDAKNEDSIVIYKSRIQSFAKLERDPENNFLLTTLQDSLGGLHEKLNSLDETTKNIESAVKEKNLKIKCKVSLGETVAQACDLGSPKAGELREAFKDSVNMYFGDDAKGYLTSYDSISTNNLPANTIGIEFTITSSNEIFLRDYLYYPEGQSDLLWAEIKRMLQESLPGAQISDPKSWGPGSIIIKVLLLKEGNVNWTNWELKLVDLLLVTFEEGVEKYIHHVKCVCKRVEQPKISADELLELKSQTVVQVGFDLCIQSAKRFDKEWMVASMNRILGEKNIKLKNLDVIRKERAVLTTEEKGTPNIFYEQKIKELKEELERMMSLQQEKIEKHENQQRLLESRIEELSSSLREKDLTIDQLRKDCEANDPVIRGLYERTLSNYNLLQSENNKLHAFIQDNVQPDDSDITWTLERPASNASYGVTFEENTGTVFIDQSRVTIKAVEQHLGEVDLRVGDFVISINDKNVTNSNGDHIKKIIDKSGLQLRLVVRRWSKPVEKKYNVKFTAKKNNEKMKLAVVVFFEEENDDIKSGDKIEQINGKSIQKYSIKYLMEKLTGNKELSLTITRDIFTKKRFNEYEIMTAVPALGNEPVNKHLDGVQRGRRRNSSIDDSTSGYYSQADSQDLYDDFTIRGMTGRHNIEHEGKEQISSRWSQSTPTGLDNIGYPRLDHRTNQAPPLLPRRYTESPSTRMRSTQSISNFQSSKDLYAYPQKGFSQIKERTASDDYDYIPNERPKYFDRGQEEQITITITKKGVEKIGFDINGGNKIGIYVVNVEENSVAARFDIQDGWKILKINGQSMDNVALCYAYEYLLTQEQKHTIDIHFETISLREYHKRLRSKPYDSFEVEALSDYVARYDQEISFEKGQRISILDSRVFLKKETKNYCWKATIDPSTSMELFGHIPRQISSLSPSNMEEKFYVAKKELMNVEEQNMTRSHATMYKIFGDVGQNLLPNV